MARTRGYNGRFLADNNPPGPFASIVDYAGDAYQVTPNGITSSAEIGMIGGMPVGFKASTERAILGTQKSYGRKVNSGNRSGE